MAKAAAVPVLGPESRDKEARMRSMLDAAVALFAEDGYAAVSTRRIAEVAGCSETLLFRYFGGKRGLLLAICNDLMVPHGTRPDPDDFASLKDFLEAQLLWVFENEGREGARLKVITAAIVGDAELSAEFEQRHDAEVAVIAGELRRFQERGEIAGDVDLQATAVLVEQTGFSVGLLMQVVYNKPKAELNAVAEVFARALSNGLRGNAEEPLPRSVRQDAIRAARDASQELQRLVGLLNGR